MQILVEVMPKEGILDPQGQAVGHALHQLGYREVQSVKVGKRIVLEVEGDDAAEALKRGREMAEKLLHNENVEEFHVLLGEESAS